MDKNLSCKQRHGSCIVVNKSGSCTRASDLFNRECVFTAFCHNAFSHIAYLSRLTCFLSSMLINALFTFYYDFISQLWSIILFWLDHLLKEFKRHFSYSLLEKYLYHRYKILNSISPP